MLNPAATSLFHTRAAAICREMGATLIASAFSPNIRDRHDFSCALFDPKGRLVAQAAHIPVHLGSMAYAMADLVTRFAWRPGDMVILNDPYLGGTHLPDVTLVAPAFVDGALIGFCANRAHHADIGSDSPGSMPLSHTLEEEGLIIAPAYLIAAGQPASSCMAMLKEAFAEDAPTFGDINAQVAANRRGVTLFERLVAGLSRPWTEHVAALFDYAGALARGGLSLHQGAVAQFTDLLDDDGAGTINIPIRVRVDIHPEHVDVNFAGTSPEVAGNLNCPLSVTAAAVYYVFYCLMPRETPACHGAFSSIRIHAPRGCLLNANRPAAVAAGNVETSSRIVDALIGALGEIFSEQMPAASQGTMNNLAMGTKRWSYYETLAGGTGAHARGPGMSATHSHMTNTRNTSVEVLESTLPLRVRRYALALGSGGVGRHAGGDGLIREYEFLEPTQVTLISDRRVHPPWGRVGGASGAAGVNLLNGVPLPGKTSFTAKPGDRLAVMTPGGGGFGHPPRAHEGPARGVESPKTRRRMTRTAISQTDDRHE